MTKATIRYDSISRAHDAYSSVKRRNRDLNQLRPEVTTVLMQFRELFKISARHFQHIEASCGVTGSQLWVLMELQIKPGLNISELASILSISPATAGNILSKLEKKDLVRCERPKEDLRACHTYLTLKGEEILARVPKPAQGVMPGALDRLSVDTLNRLNRDLGALLKIVAVRDH